MVVNKIEARNYVKMDKLAKSGQRFEW